MAPEDVALEASVAPEQAAVGAEAVGTAAEVPHPEAVETHEDPLVARDTQEEPTPQVFKVLMSMTPMRSRSTRSVMP